MSELDKDEQFYRDTESIAFPNLDASCGAASCYSKRASAISA